MARDLRDDEKELWRRVVESITPIASNRIKQKASQGEFTAAPAKRIAKPINNQASLNKANPTRADLAAALSKPIHANAPVKRANRLINQDALRNSQRSAHNGLDGHWEKRFTKGVVIPDISIDLHGAGLQSAYDRLDGALEQARAQKLRVILLVTGRQRQYDRASGEGRGGIRAVMSDWLSASRHSEYIASVRNAHPRHGGAGALYIILRK